MCMIHNDTHIIVTLLRTLNQNFKIRRSCDSRTIKVHLSLRSCDRVDRVDLKRFKSKNDFVDVSESFFLFENQFRVLSSILQNQHLFSVSMIALITFESQSYESEHSINIYIIISIEEHIEISI